MFHSFFISHWRKMITPLLVVVVLLAFMFIPRGRANHSPLATSEDHTFLENFNQDNEMLEENIEVEEIHETIIIVDVQGAVQFPGVYALKEDDRLIDAIQAAGGYMEGAETRFINHALKLADEMLIYIPLEGEEIEGSIGQGSPASGLVSSGQQTSKETGVNINTADTAQLMTLPGIGPAKAASIIQYREENGPFQTIEDIMNISGIGQKTFEKLQPSLTVK